MQARTRNVGSRRSSSRIARESKRSLSDFHRGDTGGWRLKWSALSLCGVANKYALVRPCFSCKQRSFRDDQTNFDGSRIVLSRRYGSLGVAGIANSVTSTAEPLRPDPGRKEGRRRQTSRRRHASWRSRTWARSCTRTCTWTWTWTWARARARALVAWSLVRLRRRLMLAMDPCWLYLDLRLLSSGQWSKMGVGFGRPPYFFLRLSISSLSLCRVASPCVRLVSEFPSQSFTARCQEWMAVSRGKAIVSVVAKIADVNSGHGVLRLSANSLVFCRRVTIRPGRCLTAFRMQPAQSDNHR